MGNVRNTLPSSFIRSSGIYHCVATSSEDFDTTLMICILRSLRYVSRPSKGWANIPPVGENSLGANLTRIKEYRNQLCHRPKARINDKEFRKIWCDLTRVSITCLKLFNDLFYMNNFASKL